MGFVSHRSKANASIGVDLGITTFVTLSNDLSLLPQPASFTPLMGNRSNAAHAVAVVRRGHMLTPIMAKLRVAFNPI